MVQRLNSTVYSGVSNIYGILITMATLLVIFITLVLHLIWVEINEGNIDKTTDEYGGVSRETMVGLYLVFTFIHWIPFRSCALRLLVAFIEIDEWFFLDINPYIS